MIDTDRFRYLLDAYDICTHDDVRVDLSPLHEIYRIAYFDAPLHLTSYVDPPAKGLVSEANPAIVHLNYNLNDVLRRIYYAHEIAHVVLEHLGSRQTRALHAVYNDRQENEAWEGAAYMLVTGMAVLTGQTTDRIAEIAGVTTDLVVRHPWLDRGRIAS